MSIKAQVLNSLKWLVIARSISQVTRWFITFFVIRLLMPEDYGLMAISDVIISFLVLFSSAGLASAVIQSREYTHNQLRALLGLLLLINGVLMLALWFGAPWVADFYHDERIVGILHWMQLGFLFGAFEALPMAVLSKEMRFKEISIAELIAAMCSSFLTLGLALNGYGYKALLFGYLAEMGLRALLKNIALRRLIVPSFRFVEIKALLKYGSIITVAAVFWFIYTRYDVFVAGRMWDVHMLGFYAIAMQIALIPLDKAIVLLQRVAFPAFSSLAAEKDKVQSHILKANRIAMQVVFPVFFGMSLIAPLVVPWVLGEKWQQAVFPLQIVTLILPLRVSLDLLSPALKGMGMADMVLKTVLTALAIMIPALTIGAMYGLQGLALAWLFAFPIAYLINVYRSLSVLGVDIRRFTREMLTALGAASMMYLVGSVVIELMDGRVPIAITVASVIIASAMSYIALLYAFARENLIEMKQLFAR